MKKCPKCHKNIPSNAKVCPYCGTPQSGYQPMKRTPKRKYAFIYPILLLHLFSYLGEFLISLHLMHYLIVESIKQQH